MASARKIVRRGPYKMTAKRKTALRKAQMVSARKRKGKGRAAPVNLGGTSRKTGMSTKKKVAVGAIGVTAVVGSAVAYHKISGSQLTITSGKLHSDPNHSSNRHLRKMPKANSARIGAVNFGKGHVNVNSRVSVNHRYVAAVWEHKGKRRGTPKDQIKVPKSDVYKRVVSNRAPIVLPKPSNPNAPPKPPLKPGTFTYKKRNPAGRKWTLADMRAYSQGK